MSNYPPLQLLANVKAQARALAKIQNIQLSQAYEILSWVVYRCPNYQDLRNRLLNPELKSQWFELAEITSNSSTSQLDKFKATVPVLVERFSSRLLCNTNRLGLTEAIYDIFGVSHPENIFNTLFPGISTSRWRVLLDKKVTPLTVLESHTQINGIMYRLLAINVFLPLNVDFKKQEHKDLAESISPTSIEEFHLSLGDSAAWLKSLERYITSRQADPTDDFVEFIPPSQELTKREQQLENSMRDALEIMGIDDWDNVFDNPIPMSFSGDISSSSYLILGYPIASTQNLSEITENNTLVITPDKSAINDYQTVLIEGHHPAAIEWISVDPETNEHNGDYFEYFQLIKRFLSDQEDSSYIVSQQQDMSHLMLIRPISENQIRSDLRLEPHIESGKETWHVSVENCAFAEKIITKITSLDLYVHENQYGAKKFFCKFKYQSESDRKVSINVARLSNSMRTYSDIIEGIYSGYKGDEITIYICIYARAIDFINIVGKEKFIKSMRSGLINHIDKGALGEIDNREPTTFDHLPRLSPSESEIINSVKLPLMDLFSLFSNLSTAEYERQSY